MAGKFGRRVREGDVPDRFHTAFEIEKYLEYQGAKFVERFDANSYLHITQAMDRFDLGKAWGRSPEPASKVLAGMASVERSKALDESAHIRLREAFERAQCAFLVVALSSDWLFPASESWQVAEALLELGKPVSFCELASPHGHDGFLLEVDQLDRVLTAFLAPDLSTTVRRSSDSGVRGLASTVEDIEIISAMIRPGSRVLDIGCGDGSLIHHLIHELGCRGEGLDLDLEAVIPAMSKGISSLHGDATDILRRMPDGAWDHVILNQTLQAVEKPPEVLREILRVGKEAIVGFPNFAVWNSRISILLGGRMPKTPDLPFEWYETPNHHPFTLADFEDYCRREGIEILEIRHLAGTALGGILLRAGFRHLGADRAIARIARKHLDGSEGAIGNTCADPCPYAARACQPLGTRAWRLDHETRGRGRRAGRHPPCAQACGDRRGGRNGVPPAGLDRIRPPVGCDGGCRGKVVGRRGGPREPRRSHPGHFGAGPHRQHGLRRSGRRPPALSGPSSRPQDFGGDRGQPTRPGAESVAPQVVSPVR